MTIDYYQVLGVEPEADEAQIRSAYRRLARQHHPDKNGGEASEVWDSITRAYEVLADPQRRQLYDRWGEEGLTRGSMGAPQMSVLVDLPLASLWTREPVPVSLHRSRPCTECDGTGFTDRVAHNCRLCGGHGAIRRGPCLTVCPACRGAVPRQPPTCTHCQEGTQVEPITLYADPPADLTQPTAVVQDPEGTQILVQFQLQLPSDWAWDGSHLIYLPTISLADSLCGLRYLLQHPDGQRYLIRAERGTLVRPDRYYVLAGLGVAGGPLYCQFQIEYPERLEMPERKVVFNYHTLGQALGGRRPRPDEAPTETWSLERCRQYTPEQLQAETEVPMAGEGQCPMM